MATTERGAKPAKFEGARGPALFDLDGGAEYVVGGGRAGREWCGWRLGSLFAMSTRERSSVQLNLSKVMT